MQYTRLGNTGLEVSRVCLGCMSYGEPERGDWPWSLPEDEARPFFKQALDAGINFFDTANVYSAGSSEEITGRALLGMVSRDEVVIATKVYFRMRPGPNGAGLGAGAAWYHQPDRGSDQATPPGGCRGRG
jgi:aryl-alcohol dehydrogenase (NADP+)